MSYLSVLMNTNKNNIIVNRLNSLLKLSKVPRVDLKELKYLIHTYFHNDFSVLLKLDQEDSLDDSSNSTDSEGIPTTALQLHEKLSWADLKVIIEALKIKTSYYKGLKVTGWEIYILNDWVGIVDLDFITQLEQITGAENLKTNRPEVNDSDKEMAVKELICRLEKYL